MIKKKSLAVLRFIPMIGLGILCMMPMSCSKEEEEPTYIGYVNGHEYVDLGLPSGTKWATCNVGATSPEDAGGYFAWGETSAKSSYILDTYAHYNSSSYEYLDIGTDIAGTSYDVAHVRWGGTWQMPTFEQFNELINKCTSQKTTINGIKGLEFFGANGASIFIPTTGYYWEGHEIIYKNEGAYLWLATQTPDKVKEALYGGYINYGSERIPVTNSFFRYKGLAVRPVTK